MEEVKNLNEKEEVSWKRIVGIVLNTIFYLFIAFLLIFSVTNLVAAKKGVKPNLFGTYIMTVQTDSMDGDKKDSFRAQKDIIFARKANDKLIEKLEVGDIITFEDASLPDVEFAGFNSKWNTHRIIEIQEVGGEKFYLLEGDNPKFKGMTNLVAKDDIIAVYTGKAKGLGFVYSKTGFITCVIIPTVVLLLIEGVFLVRNLLLLNKQKLTAELEAKEEQSKLDLEAERERIRQELLAEMNKKEEEKTE